MTLYYEDEFVQLHHGDCFNVMAELPDDSVDAIVTDPPYNIGKASWDRIDDYDQWCVQWIAQSDRVLTPSGAFWCFHSSPLSLAMIMRAVQAHGRELVSWITLDKSRWGIANRYKNAGTKTFPASVEYAAYARREVYADQIRAGREALGMTRAELDAAVSPSRKPTGIAYRWEHGERIPQPPEVEKLKQLGITVTLPTFSNPEKYSVVWPFPQADTADHPTAKPLAVMDRIIRTTTVPGDVVLDPFAGSGTTLLAARNQGRRAVGIERDEAYCEVVADRLSQQAFIFEEMGA